MTLAHLEANHPEACWSCRFWHANEFPVPATGDAPYAGSCRINPPVVGLTSKANNFPVTLPDAWCGKWDAA